MYNKYFPTCGGGEKHAGGIAEVLSRDHDVTILHAGIVDVEKASDKLNLDFSRVKFVRLGENRDIDFDVIEYTKIQKPDIFINATYLSSLLPDAPVRIALIFFPKFRYTSVPHFTEKVKSGSEIFYFQNTII